MAAATQQALTLTGNGQDLKALFQIAEVAKPSAGPGQLLVKVVATGLNPIDFKIANYGFGFTKFPLVLGCDVAGYVVEVGEGVTGWALGDDVCAYNPLGAEGFGGYAEYVLVIADVAFKKPANISFDSACAFPLAFSTAGVALFHDMKVPETNGGGANLLIWGGSSGVGMAAIQLARDAGLRVMTTCSPANADLVKSLGAAAVFDYRDANVIEKIRADAAATGGLKWAFDAAGGAVECTKAVDGEGSRVVTVVGAEAAVAAAPGGVAVSMTMLIGAHTPGNPQRAFLERLNPTVFERISSGAFKVISTQDVGGLDGVVDGLILLSSGKVSASKLVAHPSKSGRAMAALVVSSCGDFRANHRVVAQVKPTAGAGQLLVRVDSAALNPVDWKQCNYGFAITPPTSVGCDIAGVVEAVGEGVSGWAVGDRVAHYAPLARLYWGGFAEYALADATVAFHLPDNVSTDQAATIPLGIITGAVGLFHDMKVPESGNGGEAILVWGGSSSVGLYTIQLAVAAGLTVYTTCSPHNEALVRSLGASHVFDYRAAGIVDTLRAAAPGGAGFKWVYDAIGGEACLQAVACLNSGGTLTTVLSADKARAAAPPNTTVLATFVGGVHTPDSTMRAYSQAFFAGLTDRLRSGAIVPNTVNVLGGLNAVIGGLALLHDNKVSAQKLVVHPRF